MVTPSRGVLLVQFPVDEAYWSCQPVRSTGVELALKSSMKSDCQGAPELPPPP